MLARSACKLDPENDWEWLSRAGAGSDSDMMDLDSDGDGESRRESDGRDEEDGEGGVMKSRWGKKTRAYGLLTASCINSSLDALNDCHVIAMPTSPIQLPRIVYHTRKAERDS